MKKHIFIIIEIILLTSHSWAQNAFRRFNDNEGLSHSEVKAIVQDSYGYVWIGTRNKLNRYEGNKFRSFDCYDSVYHKRNNNISALLEDSRRLLWIGTDKGVFLYNPVDETFTALERWLAHPVEVVWDWVENIVMDKSGNIWVIMPNSGVLRVDIALREAKLYKVVKDLKPSVSNPQCIAIDSYGKVWVGCNGSGIYTYDKDKDIFIPVNENNKFFSGKDIYAICHYENFLYVGLHQGELVKYNKVTGETLTDEFPVVNSQIIRCLSIQNNELWVGTSYGLYRLNLFTKNWKVIHENSFDSYSLSNNTVTVIYKDKENGVWIGTMYGGLNYLSANSRDFRVYTPNGTKGNIHTKWVHGLYSDDDSGLLWIGTEDEGYSVYNPKTDTFKRLTMSDTQVFCFRRIGEDIWVGTFKKGLDIVKPDFSVRHYDNNALGINEASICAIFEDHAGNVWLGDQWSVYMAPQGSMKFKRVEALGFGYIHDIIEDRHRNIWVATMGSGVYCYNPTTGSVIHYQADGKKGSLSSNSVSNILEDSKGRLWMSTDRGGICCYENGKFHTYSLSEGLPDDVTFKAVEDRNGNIWFGTNNGLVCLNPENRQVKVFTSKEGLRVSSFNYHSAVIDKKGYIAMGSRDGLVIFNPDKFTQNKYIPPVYFTTFDVNGVEWLPNAVNEYPKDFCITLPYNHGNITIGFAALSYMTPAANGYAYRMEGIDQDWISTAKNTVSYANLSPGDYCFLIKGANNMGIWNNTVYKLKIRSLPPWWASPFAYGTYIILFLLFIGYLFWVYSRRAARKNEEKNLMYSIEKEKELYEAKLTFFTNIIHEIRTPLTLINGPLEIMMQERKELPSKLQHYMYVAKQNVEQLLNLVNQLLEFRTAENKNSSLSYTQIPVLAFIDKVKERFSVSLARQNKQLEVRLSENFQADLMLVADREALNKILNNLLFNAIKYSDAHIILRISSNAGFLIIELLNDGILIPSNIRESIFEPFVRAENSDKHIGTGIGLSLCRTLTEQHGGTLKYEVHDGFNCFVLSLPLKHQIELKEEKVLETSQMLSVGDKEEQPILVKPLLLLVEDNKDVVDFLCDQLSGSYHILTASNGLQALDVIYNNRVEIIISDIIMPEMDGLTLCSKLKTDVETSHIIIILLTSKNDIDSKIRGLEAGADAYVEKPFNLSYLMALIKSLIINRNRERNLFNSKPLVPIGQMEMNRTDEQFMNRVVEEIHKNMSDPGFNVETLVRNMYMSHSNFSRKLKSTINMTPSDFIRLIRLKQAALLISEGNYRINEVSSMVGINSTSNFIQMFQKQFGKTPNEFKKECSLNRKV